MATKFAIDGKVYVFNPDAFNRIFRIKKKECVLSCTEYESKLAEAANVSASSIHAYRFNKNGPGDIETVKAIADFWHLDMYLLLKEGENKQVERLNDREKEAVRRIYVAIRLFMHKFMSSDGIFSSKLDGTWIGEGNEIQYQYISQSAELVQLAYDKEYVDLSRHPIYKELGIYIDNDLNEMYDGKCSGSVRYEPEDFGGIPASNDYIVAREKLLKIIDKYI